MKDNEIADTHRALLSQFQIRDVIPRAEVPEQIWSNLEARGMLERTIGGYLRLTEYGRAALGK